MLLRPTMVGILRCGKMLPPQLNWPVIKDMLFMPFCLVLNLVFSRARSLSKQSVFRKCFFAENLGEGGGGGKNFGMRSYSEVA